MRTMYDSTAAGRIPAKAPMVAGYLDGDYIWGDDDWARFDGRVRVGIVVRASTDNGHVLDVEAGDAAPGQVPGWCGLRRAAGCDPSVYCSLSTWWHVVEACRQQQVALPHFWLADWDGRAELIPGVVAVQYRATGPFDLSLVEGWWPGVDDGQTWASGNVNTPAPRT